MTLSLLDTIQPMANRGRTISIIVPTYCEAPNLQPLCRRVCDACREADIEPEIIFVDDDSADGSEEIVADLAKHWPVRIIVRRNQRGLSSAVLAGFEAATSHCLLVMDADLQHPPEQVPLVAEPILTGQADICVGSRYVSAGRLDEDWPLLRRLNSYIATALARPLTNVRDCMAGFFALRRDVLADCPPLNPVGYKILLELLAKAHGARVVEVPITFGPRHAGQSKLRLREQLAYLRHLLRLYRFRYPWLLGIAALVLVALPLTVLLVGVLLIPG